MITAMKIFKQARWKFLLGVFKIKRFVNRWFGVRRLDYGPKDIFILTDTLREWETRARSVGKEPKTVPWLEKHGGVGTVFYDIGANIGAYSLVAAAQGAMVIAFEPAPHNFYKIHENILLNKLNDKITVVPLALAENEGVIVSYVVVKTFGASHSFSFQEKPSEALPAQSFLAMDLDTCVKTFSLPLPTMMKIDVDGAEKDVVNGARTLLNHPHLKHLLVEIIDELSIELIRDLTDMGFKLVDQEIAGTGATNYIFERL